MADSTNKPDNPAPADWLQQAQVLLVQNEWGGLISLLSAVIPALQTNAEKAVAYRSRGFAYDLIGKHDLAIADYNRLIELNPKDAEVYDRRGDVYSKKGELDLAIADYNRAIEEKPEYATAHSDRGNAYLSKGELDLAIADYNRAIELAPNRAITHALRGQAHAQKGDYDKAIADWEKGIELNPSTDLAEALRKSIKTSAQLRKQTSAKLHPEAGQLPGQALGQSHEEISAKQAELHQLISEALSPEVTRLRKEVSEELVAETARLREQISAELAAEAARLREQISVELSSFKGAEEFKEREDEHDAAHKRAGKHLFWVLVALLVFYLVAFAILAIVLLVREGKTEPLEILPWITAIFLTSSPIIWLARILSREKTWHFALRENAYANRLMTNLLFYKPPDDDAKELVRKFFDHHSLRGSAQLILGADGEKKTDEGIIERFINFLRQGGGKQGD